MIKFTVTIDFINGYSVANFPLADNRNSAALG
jgi:hypothetical protein